MSERIKSRETRYSAGNALATVGAIMVLGAAMASDLIRNKDEPITKAKTPEGEVADFVDGKIILREPVRLTDDVSGQGIIGCGENKKNKGLVVRKVVDEHTGEEYYKGVDNADKLSCATDNMLSYGDPAKPEIFPES